jgi:hypothetical protein
MSQAREIKLFKIHIASPDGMQLSRDFQISLCRLSLSLAGVDIAAAFKATSQYGGQKFLHEVPATGKKVSWECFPTY